MAYRLRLIAWFDWVPDGAGGAALGQLQGQNPGLGTVGVAQSRRYQQMEAVPGLDAPTAANFSTALTNGATDLNTQITAAELAILQGWATGLP